MESLKSMVGSNTQFLAGIVCGVISSLLVVKFGIFKSKSKEVSRGLQYFVNSKI